MSGGARPLGRGGVLRVSLDVSAVPDRPAGAGRYALELARHLARLDDELELVLICRAGDRERWRAVAPGAREVVALAPSPRPLRLGWEQLRMPSTLHRLGVDVHHGPHYTMPENAEMPRVVTVHDLTFFDHPEWHQRSKAVFFRRATRVAARSASVLVTVSATTAKRLGDLLAPAAPIVVAPHGIDHDRFRPDEPAPGYDRAALATLGIGRRPFVLFLGTIEPRKDVVGVVRAFDRLSAVHHSLLLVLAGGRGWGDDEVDREIAASRAAERVVRLGYVEDRLVPTLLRSARAMVYPSLEEGFGLPVLEALACGAPLVTTKGSAMEEVAEGAALLVAPGDHDGLAGAIDMVVQRDAGLSARRERGLEVAGAHTWEASARRHLEAYRLAARRGR
jgi:glycosyltransferase involved in cell wall biosynthesis